MLAGSEHFYPLFREAVTRLAACKVVLDLGTSYRFRKELEPFAHRFAGRYVALGHHARACFGDRNVNVDGDIQALPFQGESADGVLCIEVLEHVPNPQAAVDEMYRVLRHGGQLLLTTPFLSGYHGESGEYGDFYRYTDEGLRYLLRRFRRVEVHPKGGMPYRVLLTLVPSALSRLVLRSSWAVVLFNALDRRFPTRSPVGWFAWAEK